MLITLPYPNSVSNAQLSTSVTTRSSHPPLHYHFNISFPTSTSTTTMDTANHKSVSFIATQPAHVQIRKTLDTMTALGGDLRKWNGSARKELRYGGDITGTAPKLALVVVSSVFRDYLENKPDAVQVKIVLAGVEDAAVAVLLKWTNTMVNNLSAKFGVGIPG